MGCAALDAKNVRLLDGASADMKNHIGSIRDV
jgi:hypothetical protein